MVDRDDGAYGVQGRVLICESEGRAFICSS